MSVAIVPPRPPAKPALSPATATSALVALFDQFLIAANMHVESHPWLVVIAMHEVFRNLYPADSFLPFDPDEPHAVRIGRILDESTQRLNDAGSWPSYFAATKLADVITAGSTANRLAESETQRLYGSLWDQFDTNVYIEEAARILRERFAETGFLEAIAPGTTLLDAGCGSGRYAMALARLTQARCIGLDLGATSLEHTRRIASAAGISNLDFRAGDVLDLPFADGSIDCVFSNGVLHHTGDTVRGLREMHRVQRPGGRAFLYLYGAGGLFWHARRAAREVMKLIPPEYTAGVLRMIGMPVNRFIFADTWYVPIEEHIDRNALEAVLGEIGFTDIEKLVSRRATDLDSTEVMCDPDFAALWGDGEHRYLLSKPA